MKIVDFALKNSLLFNLLTLVVVGAGIMQLLKMRREAFPAINFDIVAITTIYPGASPREVELYVTNPIEKEIKGISGIKESTSVSIDGFSSITLKIDADLSYKAKQQTIDDVRNAVQRVSDLPDDLPEPTLVTEISSGRLPVMEVALAGDLPYETLHRYADQIAGYIEDIPGVAEVARKGYLEDEFWVELDPKKLRTMNLSALSVVNIFLTSNINLPGGVLEKDSGEVMIRTVGEAKSVEDLAQMVLRSSDDGRTVRVKDVGSVRTSYEDRTEAYQTNSNPSINLNVIKTESGDIITIVDMVKEKIASLQAAGRFVDVEASYVNDFSIFVRNRLGVLTSNGVVGIILVLVALLLFLNPYIAFVTAVGMPIAFMAAFVAIGYSGMTINLITMFGLVIVLGMLVDDAIIVAENIWQHYESGLSPYDAALKGASEVILPVTATILTSIAAFSPLLMLSGIFGKFIQYIPMVVIICLAMSLLEAMLVLPSHVYDAIKVREFFGMRRSNVKAIGESNSKLVQFYARVLRKVLKLRYLFLAGFFGFFAFSLFFANHFMPLSLFPPEGVEAFAVKADLPIGSSVDQSLERFSKIEEIIRTLDSSELLDTVITVGIQQDDPNDPFTQRGSHVGKIQVFLTAATSRDREAHEIIQSIREKCEAMGKELGFVRMSFERVRTGPPVGKPIAIRVRGENLDEINGIALKLQDELVKIDGVFDVSQNFREGKDEINVIVDHEATRRTLVTVADISRTIRTAFAGTIAGYVRTSDKRIGIRVRLNEGSRRSIATLENLFVENMRGNVVPLKSLAKIETAKGVNAIYHQNYERTITVTGSIDDAKQTSESVNRIIAPKFKEFETVGAKLSAGGEFEDTEESMSGLGESFFICLSLIFVILATQFGSITLPFVVMAGIPFGIVGVIWAFFFHGMPLSFLGFVGTIGLTGVVINGSIVLLQFIRDAEKKDGMEPFEACIFASVRRFRAVWLTTITTVFGLLPLVYGIGGMDKFLQPAAVALGYGLIFGTVLILFLIPAVYMVRKDFVNLIRPRITVAEEEPVM
jgi:multidrug efflux pump subunit AcrB